MSKRIEIVSSFYSEVNEDERLNRNRCGQLEFATTMEYIHRYAKPGARVLEIGAGTGRYSIALAKEGYEVSAIELVEQNYEVLKQNGSSLSNLQAFQGDALDLSRFSDEEFDVTLVFGPMYHLYEQKDVHKALDEALRVTKKDGVILVAFLSVYAILYNNYLQGNLLAGLEENFTENYEIRHFEEQLFTGYDVTEFEQLFLEKPVQKLAVAGVDSVLELAQDRSDFAMSDEEFAAFVRYHLNFCEKRELLGGSSHLLYICRKK